MSRSSAAPPSRSLTLTEELEQLEQSITLTLQEIDHNFSRAHRIVTSSILPVVEQYAAHSKEVCEGSQFWKQFFESSANVSLSGYEEAPAPVEPLDSTETEDSDTALHTTLEMSESCETPSVQHMSSDLGQDLDLSSLTLSPSLSTPRPAGTRPVAAPAFADYPSPYESLRQEVIATTGDAGASARGTQHETPHRPTFDVDVMESTPQPSPSPPGGFGSLPRPATTKTKTDPLLHRVLDRNYRVHATPLAVAGYQADTPRRHTTTPSTTRKDVTTSDLTLSSSPEVAPPELHPDIFSSPERRHRIPGVSVLTPKQHQKVPMTAPTPTANVWDSDDDDLDDDPPFGQSPPKTIQFHIPQNRLLRTPAKEASQRIVEDILTSAGMDFGDDEIDFSRELETHAFDLDATSPSVVRRANVEDETF